jgi:hypothetical protein
MLNTKPICARVEWRISSRAGWHRRRTDSRRGGYGTPGCGGLCAVALLPGRPLPAEGALRARGVNSVADRLGRELSPVRARPKSRGPAEDNSSPSRLSTKSALFVPNDNEERAFSPSRVQMLSMKLSIVRRQMAYCATPLALRSSRMRRSEARWPQM